MWKKRTLKATSVALLSVMAFGFAGMTTTEASSRRPPEPPRYEEHQPGPHGDRDRDVHARPASHENVRHHDDHRNPPPPPEQKKKKSNNTKNVAIAAVAGAVVGAVIAKNT